MAGHSEFFNAWKSLAMCVARFRSRRRGLRSATRQKEAAPGGRTGHDRLKRRFFIACFSRRSTAKRGCFQSELRYALECANRVAFDEIYFLPVRFEECEVPPRIARHLQYVSLFPDWDEGVRALVQAMRDQIARRRRADGRSQ